MNGNTQEKASAGTLAEIKAAGVGNFQPSDPIILTGIDLSTPKRSRLRLLAWSIGPCATVCTPWPVSSSSGAWSWMTTG